MSNQLGAIDGWMLVVPNTRGRWWESLWLVLEFELLFVVSIELSGGGLDCQVQTVRILNVCCILMGKF